MQPGFRPDNYIILNENFPAHLKKLETCTNISIHNLETLLLALKKRIEYFHENGCRISDHGLQFIPTKIHYTKALDTSFQSFLLNGAATNLDKTNFTGYILSELCKIYSEKNGYSNFISALCAITMQDCKKLIGVDCGADSIGDFKQAEGLSILLSHLDEKQ